MNAALSFLNDFAQWLARWVPRLVLIQPTHRGVLFGPRGGARELQPGLRVYWPITHVLVLMAVTTQSTRTRALHIMGLVDNRTSAAVARHYARHSADRQAWAAATVKDLSGELEHYGILVERIDFTGFATGVALKRLDDWNYRDSSNGTRPE